MDLNVVFLQMVYLIKNTISPKHNMYGHIKQYELLHLKLYGLEAYFITRLQIRPMLHFYTDGKLGL